MPSLDLDADILLPGRPIDVDEISRVREAARETVFLVRISDQQDIVGYVVASGRSLFPTLDFLGAEHWRKHGDGSFSETSRALATHLARWSTRHIQVEAVGKEIAPVFIVRLGTENDTEWMWHTRTEQHTARDLSIVLQKGLVALARAAGWLGPVDREESSRE